jgi:hypothetical protein
VLQARQPLIHKPGQRREFFEFLRLQGWPRDLVTSGLLGWAGDHTVYQHHISRLEAFLRPNRHTNFLVDDQVLYDYCEHLGCRAPEGAFNGEREVQDFLEKFAIANGNDHMSMLGRHSGTYDILRPGSYDVRDGKPPERWTQRFVLRIRRLNVRSPHATFRYEDLKGANADKPDGNRFTWHGRVVATGDALFLIGVSSAYADAAMMVLWRHPEEANILVGVQLAKLRSDDDKDDRDYTISRRIAAVKRAGGRTDSSTLREVAYRWISAPFSGFVPIDRPPPRASNTD